MAAGNAGVADQVDTVHYEMNSVFHSHHVLNLCGCQ